MLQNSMGQLMRRIPNPDQAECFAVGALVQGFQTDRSRYKRTAPLREKSSLSSPSRFDDLLDAVMLCSFHNLATWQRMTRRCVLLGYVNLAGFHEGLTSPATGDARQVLHGFLFGSWPACTGTTYGRFPCVSKASGCWCNYANVEFGIGTHSGDSTTDRMTPQRCMRHVSFVIFTYEPLIV